MCFAESAGRWFQLCSRQKAAGNVPGAWRRVADRVRLPHHNPTALGPGIIHCRRRELMVLGQLAGDPEFGSIPSIPVACLALF